MYGCAIFKSLCSRYLIQFSCAGLSTLLEILFIVPFEEQKFSVKMLAGPAFGKKGPNKFGKDMKRPPGMPNDDKKMPLLKESDEEVNQESTARNCSSCAKPICSRSLTN